MNSVVRFNGNFLGHSQTTWTNFPDLTTYPRLLTWTFYLNKTYVINWLMFDSFSK